MEKKAKPTNDKDITVGSVVHVALSLDRKTRSTIQRRRGTVRYVGKAGTANTWLGIELDQHYGKHDGKAKNNINYFHCDKGKGVYVRPWHVLLEKSPPSTASKIKTGLNDETSDLNTVTSVIDLIQSLATVADVQHVQDICIQKILQLEKQEKCKEKQLFDRRTHISRVYSHVGEEQKIAASNTTPSSPVLPHKKFGGARVDLVVREIHETERSYVDDLTTIVDVFAKPLVQYNIITSEQSKNYNTSYWQCW